MTIQSLFRAGNETPSEALKQYNKIYGFSDLKFAQGWAVKNNYQFIYQFTTDKYYIDDKQYLRDTLTNREMSDNEYVCYSVISERLVDSNMLFNKELLSQNIQREGEKMKNIIEKLNYIKKSLSEAKEEKKPQYKIIKQPPTSIRKMLFGDDDKIVKDDERKQFEYDNLSEEDRKLLYQKELEKKQKARDKAREDEEKEEERQRKEREKKFQEEEDKKRHVIKRMTPTKPRLMMYEPDTGYYARPQDDRMIFSKKIKGKGDEPDEQIAFSVPSITVDKNELQKVKRRYFYPKRVREINIKNKDAMNYYYTELEKAKKQLVGKIVNELFTLQEFSTKLGLSSNIISDYYLSEIQNQSVEKELENTAKFIISSIFSDKQQSQSLKNNNVKEITILEEVKQTSEFNNLVNELKSKRQQILQQSNVIEFITTAFKNYLYTISINENNVILSRKLLLSDIQETISTQEQTIIDIYVNQPDYDVVDVLEIATEKYVFGKKLDTTIEQILNNPKYGYKLDNIKEIDNSVNDINKATELQLHTVVQNVINKYIS